MFRGVLGPLLSAWGFASPHYNQAMTVSDQIDSFSDFAKATVSAGESASIDELYSRWRATINRDVDAAAVMASVRDIEAGERGQLLSEFIDEQDRQPQR